MARNVYKAVCGYIIVSSMHGEFFQSNNAPLNTETLLLIKFYHLYWLILPMISLTLSPILAGFHIFTLKIWFQFCKLIFTA